MRVKYLSKVLVTGLAISRLSMTVPSNIESSAFIFAVVRILIIGALFLGSDFSSSRHSPKIWRHEGL